MTRGTGRHFLILNPDVEVGRGAIDALVEFVDAHPAVGIVGPKLLDPDGSLQYSARTFYSLSAILLRRTFLPNRALAGAAEGPALDALGKLAPAARDRRALGGRATAFVCEHGRCELPAVDAAGLEAQLAPVRPLR